MAWYDDEPELVQDDGRVSRRPRVYYMIDGSREEQERHMVLERMEAHREAVEELELREARAARDVLRMLGQE